MTSSMIEKLSDQSYSIEGHISAEEDISANKHNRPEMTAKNSKKAKKLLKAYGKQ